MLELVPKIFFWLTLALAVGFAVAWLLRGLGTRERIGGLQAELANERALRAAAQQPERDLRNLRGQVAELEAAALHHDEALRAAQAARRSAEARAGELHDAAEQAAARAQRDLEVQGRLAAERGAALEELQARFTALEQVERAAQARAAQLASALDEQAAQAQLAAQRATEHSAGLVAARQRAEQTLAAERLRLEQAISVEAGLREEARRDAAAARAAAIEAAAAAGRQNDQSLAAQREVLERMQAELDAARSQAGALAPLRDEVQRLQSAAAQAADLDRELAATRAEFAALRENARQSQNVARHGAVQRDTEVERLNEELARRSDDLDALGQRIDGEQAVVARREQDLAARLQETASRAEAAQAEVVALRMQREQTEARLALMAAFEAQATRFKAAVAERDAQLAALRSTQESSERELLATREALSAARRALAETRAAHAAAEREEADAQARRQPEAAAPEAASPAPAESEALAQPAVRDDLKRIYGIGPVLERLLNELGITQYRQIATWTPDDVRRVDAQLVKFHGRIERDDWIKGAREAHFKKYGERL
jgi:predicted flap endonuclease-1-like 5' DNA nuclease